MYQGLHIDELTSRHETMLRKRKKSLNKCSDDKVDIELSRDL